MAEKSRRHSKTLFYRRCRFVTQLPLHRLYSYTHYWICRVKGQRWRVGLTKFGTRLLGEMVEHGFSVELGTSVNPGQVIGWLEGFKAISDVVCLAQGSFAGSNPELNQNITLLDQDPYWKGWIYETDGKPGDFCISVKAYAAHLDKTIDQLRNEADPK